LLIPRAKWLQLGNTAVAFTILEPILLVPWACTMCKCHGGAVHVGRGFFAGNGGELLCMFVECITFSLELAGKKINILPFGPFFIIL
jgi:hypothetical protein